MRRFNELRVRASQRVAAFSERRGWSNLVKLPETVPNAALLNERLFLDFTISDRGPWLK